MKKQIHYCIPNCPFLGDKLKCAFYDKTVIMDTVAKRPRKAFKCYINSVDQSISMIDGRVANITEQVFNIQNLINGLDSEEVYRKEDLARHVEFTSKLLTVIKNNSNVEPEESAEQEVNNPVDIKE